MSMMILEPAHPGQLPLRIQAAMHLIGMFSQATWELNEFESSAYAQALLTTRLFVSGEEIGEVPRECVESQPQPHYPPMPYPQPMPGGYSQHCASQPPYFPGG